MACVSKAQAIERITWMLALLSCESTKASLLLLLIVAFGSLRLGYRWWARGAIGSRRMVGRDESDIATLQGAATLGSYDPCFDQVNFVRAIKLPITNSRNVGAKP
jgi:hypothetical protein